MPELTFGTDKDLPKDQDKRARRLVSQTQPLLHYKPKYIYREIYTLVTFLWCPCRSEERSRLRRHLIWKNLMTQAKYGILIDEAPGDDDGDCDGDLGSGDEENKNADDSDNCPEICCMPTDKIDESYVDTEGKQQTKQLASIFFDKENSVDIFENPFYIYGMGIYNYMSTLRLLRNLLFWLALIALAQIYLIQQDRMTMGQEQYSSLSWTDKVVYMATLGAYEQAQPKCENVPIKVDKMYFSCSGKQTIQEIKEIAVFNSKSKLCSLDGVLQDEEHTKCNQYVNQTFKEEIRRKCLNQRDCTMDQLRKYLLVQGTGTHKDCLVDSESFSQSLIIQAKCGISKKIIKERNMTGLKCSMLGVLGQFIFLFGVSYTIPMILKRRKLTGIFKTISAKNFTIEVNFDPKFFEDLYVEDNQKKKWLTCEQELNIYFDNKWQKYDKENNYGSDMPKFMPKPIEIKEEENDQSITEEDVKQLRALDENLVLDQKNEHEKKIKDPDYYKLYDDKKGKFGNFFKKDEIGKRTISYWLDQNSPALWLQIKLINQLKNILIKDFDIERLNQLLANQIDNKQCIEILEQNLLINQALKKYSDDHRKEIMKEIIKNKEEIFDVALISFSYRNDEIYEQVFKVGQSVKNKNTKAYMRETQTLQMMVQGYQVKQVNENDVDASNFTASQSARTGGYEYSSASQTQTNDYEINHNLFKEYRSLYNDNRTPAVAFITFSNPMGAFLCNKFIKYNKKNHKIFGKDLKLSRASAPCDIQFKNYGTSWPEAFGRGFHGIGLIAAWAFVYFKTIAFLYSIQQNRQIIFHDFNQCQGLFEQYQNQPKILSQLALEDFEKLSNTKNGFGLQTIAFNTTVLNDLGGQLTCLCMFKNQSSSQFQNNFDQWNNTAQIIGEKKSKQNELKDACNVVLEKSKYTSYMGLIIGLVLQLSNIITKHAVRNILGKMGITQKTNEKIWIMRFLYFIQISTQIVIVVLWGANFEFIKNVPWLKEKFKGNYRDFTQDWYQSIGQVFIIKMLFYMITPITSFGYELYYQFNVKSLTLRTRTIWDYYQSHIGYEFLLEVKLAFLICVLFLTFSFGAGMPILFPMAFMVILLHQNLVKYKLAYFHKRPINYSTKIVTSFIYQCQFLPILYSMIGFWMYSNQQIYQNEITFIKNQDELFDHKHLLKDSLTNLTPGTPFLFLFVISSLNYIYITIESMPYFEKCSFQRLKKEDEQQLRYPKRRPFYDYISQQKYVRYIRLQDTMFNLFKTRNLTDSLYQKLKKEYEERFKKQQMMIRVSEQIKKEGLDERRYSNRLEKALTKYSSLNQSQFNERQLLNIEQSEQIIQNGHDSEENQEGTTLAFTDKAVQIELFAKMRSGLEMPLQISGLSFEILLDTHYQSKLEFPYNIKDGQMRYGNKDDNKDFETLQLWKNIFIFNMGCMHQDFIKYYRIFDEEDEDRLKSFKDKRKNQQRSIQSRDNQANEDNEQIQQFRDRD